MITVYFKLLSILSIRETHYNIFLFISFSHLVLLLIHLQIHGLGNISAMWRDIKLIVLGWINLILMSLVQMNILNRDQKTMKRVLPVSFLPASLLHWE